MLTNNEKIKIINNKITNLNDFKNNMYAYIDLINDGMQDPDLTIDQCYNIISKTEFQLDALYKEREALTNALEML